MVNPTTVIIGLCWLFGKLWQIRWLESTEGPPLSVVLNVRSGLNPAAPPTGQKVCTSLGLYIKWRHMDDAQVVN